MLLPFHASCTIGLYVSQSHDHGRCTHGMKTHSGIRTAGGLGGIPQPSHTASHDRAAHDRKTRYSSVACSKSALHRARSTALCFLRNTTIGSAAPCRLDQGRSAPAEPEEADERQESPRLQRHRLHRVGRLQEPVVPGLHVADDLVRARILCAARGFAVRGARGCAAACVLVLLRRSQSRLSGFPDFQLHVTSCLASKGLCEFHWQSVRPTHCSSSQEGLNATRGQLTC